MRKSDIVAAVARETKLSQRKATQVVDLVLQEISQGLVNGEKVTLTRFGVFDSIVHRERTFFDPQGEQRSVPARPAARFRASPALNDRLRERFEPAMPPQED